MSQYTLCQGLVFLVFFSCFLRQKEACRHTLFFTEKSKKKSRNSHCAGARNPRCPGPIPRLHAFGCAFLFISVLKTHAWRPTRLAPSTFIFSATSARKGKSNHLLFRNQGGYLDGEPRFGEAHRDHTRVHGNVPPRRRAWPRVLSYIFRAHRRLHGVSHVPELKSPSPLAAF